MIVSIMLAGCFDKVKSSNTNINAEEADFSSAKPDLLNESDADVFSIRVLSYFDAFGMNAVNFKREVEKQYRNKYPSATIQWDEQTVDWVSSHFDSVNKQFIERKGPDV